MYQSSSTLSLKVYIYRRPVCGFPWGENEPNKRDTLKELKNKGGRQAKEFGQGHFACFSAFQTRFALSTTKLLLLCSSDLTYLRASRWSRCLQHDCSRPPTDCFQLEVRSNFNQRPHIIWAPDLPKTLSRVNHLPNLVCFFWMHNKELRFWAWIGLTCLEEKQMHVHVPKVTDPAFLQTVFGSKEGSNFK